MNLPAAKHPYRSILLFSTILTAAVSLGLAQASTAPPRSPGEGQPRWECIESPENTDFWNALLSSDQSVAGELAPDRLTEGLSAVAQRALQEFYVRAPLPPREENHEKMVGPDMSVVVNEDGSIENRVGEVQGNAGGTEGSSDQENCGGY